MGHFRLVGVGEPLVVVGLTEGPNHCQHQGEEKLTLGLLRRGHQELDKVSAFCQGLLKGKCGSSTGPGRLSQPLGDQQGRVALRLDNKAAWPSLLAPNPSL